MSRENQLGEILKFNAIHRYINDALIHKKLIFGIYIYIDNTSFPEFTPYIVVMYIMI